MKRVLFGFLLLIFCVVAGFAAYLVKSEKMIYRTPALVHENAKITFVVGDVKVNKGEDDGWQNLMVGEILLPGYQIKTGKSSLADIRFHSTMAIRITENSHLTIDANSIKAMDVNLKSGALYGKFHKLYDEHSLIIKTISTVAAVRGTDLAFEIGESPFIKADAVSDKDSDENSADAGSTESKSEKDEDHKEKVTEDVAMVPSTVVYALTGITEIYNPEFYEQKVLLSYQRKINVLEGQPAGDTEEISDADMDRIRKTLNSIHFEEVLLISDTILFKSGSSTILESSYEELDKIVAILNEKKVSIRIDGHTDNVGSDAKNQQLSFDRADSIRTYLIEKGIDADRLTAAGYGASQPVTDNLTKEKRAQNRRVEFIVVEQSNKKGILWW
ncbi:MAG: OmpA family protein [Spirochaetes bacterium]|jgi:outer membrane protein OmpA-like peptidoglycan-associated protein|nr:OmpA family protein [Spirochaetota bacterium]